MPPTATVNSSTVNLVKTIVGAGLLAIPYVFRNSGILVGILLTFMAAVASWFGLFALAKCSKTMINPRNSSFFTVCMMTNAQLSVFSDSAMIIQCFGVCISYLVLIGDLFPTIFGGSRYYWIISSALIIVPLCLLKNMNSLRYSSILGLFALAYLTLLVLSNFIHEFLLNEDYNLTRGDIYWLHIYNTKGLIGTFSIIIFAFTGSMNLFSIINELEENSMKNINTVITRSIGISTLLFLLVGISGYLTFGSDTTGNVMLNYDPSLMFVVIGKFCLGSMVVLSFPLLFHPLRIAVNNIVVYYQLQHKKDLVFEPEFEPPQSTDSRPISLAINDEDNQSLLDEDDNIGSGNEILDETVSLLKKTKEESYDVPFPNIRFLFITFGLLSSMYTIAIKVKSFALVLAIVGATGSTSISFILPGIFGYNLIGSNSLAIGEMINSKDKFYKKCCLCLVVFGLAVTFLSLYLIVVDGSSQ